MVPQIDFKIIGNYLFPYIKGEDWGRASLKGDLKAHSLGFRVYCLCKNLSLNWLDAEYLWGLLQWTKWVAQAIPA